MGNITGLVGFRRYSLHEIGQVGRWLHGYVQVQIGKKEGVMGQHHCCPIGNYRMAIGLPGEPVAPLRRSGAKLKANS